MPDWAQTLGMTFSIMLWMPSWGGMINGLMTLSGAWDRLRTDAVVRLLVVSLPSTACRPSKVRSCRSRQSTHSLTTRTGPLATFTPGAWLGRHGSFGAIYCLVPWLWKRKGLYSMKLVEWHFWLATIGLVLYITSMWVAGITQGLMWRAYDNLGFLKYSFIETVEAMHWPYIIRATGGLLFFLGGFVMAINVWRPSAATNPSTSRISRASQPPLNCVPASMLFQPSEKEAKREPRNF